MAKINGKVSSFRRKNHMPTLIYSPRQSVLSLFLIVFCSCQTSNDRAIIKALDESLEISNKTIKESNELILTSMEGKMYDPASYERAKILYPKAEKISILSKELNRHIEKMKNKNNFNQDQITELHLKLKKYNDEIFTIDPSIRNEFETKIVLTTISFDSISDKNLYKTFFRNVSIIASEAMLTKIQNNVRIIENKLLSFLHERTSSHPIRDFYHFFPFVIQNRTHVHKGDEIEIISGIGGFTIMADLKIKINNKEIDLNSMNYISYKFKASNKLGKHYVPVEYTYLDQDGKRILWKKTVEYTVTKSCN